MSNIIKMFEETWKVDEANCITNGKTYFWIGNIVTINRSSDKSIDIGFSGHFTTYTFATSKNCEQIYLFLINAKRSYHLGIMEVSKVQVEMFEAHKKAIEEHECKEKNA